MNEKVKIIRDGAIALFAGAGALGAIVGLIFCLGYMWNNTIGTWANDILTTTPEEAAEESYKRSLIIDEQRRQREEDLKDPSSQASIAKACIERGGTPRYSNWDGEIFECKKDEEK